MSTVAKETAAQIAREGLHDAILARERLYRGALDRLRELATSATEDEVYDLTIELHEALTLVGCLRRAVQELDENAIHRSFGAPGDFGYERPIGAALARVYRVAMGPATEKSEVPRG